MGTISRIDRDDWISDLCMHLGARAETGGWMVAVRYADDAATFGRLASSIAEYRPVLGAQSMSFESALTASLLHTLPGIANLAPAEQARALHEIVEWLGRDIPAVQERRSLRAVS